MRIKTHLLATIEKIKGLLDRQMVLMLSFGLVITVANLVITLDLRATMVVAILILSLVVFGKSFSRGWLFLLGVSLLSPAMRIGEGVFLFEIFLLILVVVSLAQFAFENNQFFIDKISFNFFLFLLVGASISVFGVIFNGGPQKQVGEIFFSFLLIWMLIFIFQYFFQTRKRIQRFLMLICFVGTAHAFYGTVAFLGGWQPFSGTGIIIGKSGRLVFEGITRQISGFLGVGLEGTIGHNFLSSFLVISILSTLGLMLCQNKKNESLKNKQDESSGRLIVALSISLMIQFIGIILTFSYSSLVSLSLGVLIIGIILRNKKIILPAIFLVVILTIFIPKFSASFNSNALANFENINKVAKHWVIGNSIVVARGRADVISGNIFNSYLFVWNYYGLFGLLILLSMFFKFFIDIYLSYKKSQGQERILLVMTTSIFVALLLEGFSGNVLIFGPTAVVFWLFYAVVLNLKNNLIPVGFIVKSGLFTSTLGFFVGGRSKSIDGIRKRINTKKIHF